MSTANDKLFDLSGQVAIITGGANGIGAATASRLAAAGASVVVADIDEQAAIKTVESIMQDGGSAAAFRADAASISDGQKLVEFAESQFGQVDILVNNAGVYRYVPLVDLTEEQWDVMYDINMKGLIFRARPSCGLFAPVSVPGKSSTSRRSAGSGPTSTLRPMTARRAVW